MAGGFWGNSWVRGWTSCKSSISGQRGKHFLKNSSQLNLYSVSQVLLLILFFAFALLSAKRWERSFSLHFISPVTRPAWPSSRYRQHVLGLKSFQQPMISIAGTVGWFSCTLLYRRCFSGRSGTEALQRCLLWWPLPLLAKVG